MAIGEAIDIGPSPLGPGAPPGRRPAAFPDALAFLDTLAFRYTLAGLAGLTARDVTGADRPEGASTEAAVV
ncbi:hypothetical protein [Microbispora siamensis]|uniref:Uncharacterized protein n=1 Tax=Microbispora siamensis TaxID=564413 RepID=A0ABQ4GT29_9ACTN|nr:hypothetical protein [Microbispora siamensis]GIH64592.1 hypothetical protein Msi02_54090 [Microbispora siamensis]